MSVVVQPTKSFDYFDNVVAEDKVKMLHPFSIARAVCYIDDQIDNHSENYQCHCFSCRIFKLFLTELLSSGNYGRLYLKCAAHMNIFFNIFINNTVF